MQGKFRYMTWASRGMGRWESNSWDASLPGLSKMRANSDSRSSNRGPFFREIEDSNSFTVATNHLLLFGDCEQ